MPDNKEYIEIVNVAITGVGEYRSLITGITGIKIELAKGIKKPGIAHNQKIFILMGPAFPLSSGSHCLNQSSSSAGVSVFPEGVGLSSSYVILD